MKKVVVFTGAGISAESGISTFRDSGGLWENHKIEDVATPEAWVKNKSLVLEFYNIRRAQLESVKPNTAHHSINELEKKFDLNIITQNVDNLHEQSGSKNVLHLHGELTMARSTKNPRLIYDIGFKPIKLGDKCELGSQLRPHIVWFGEAVPKMDEALLIASEADIMIVIGSSLQVYPAASLLYHTPNHCEHYYIDPNAETQNGIPNLSIIKSKASIGVPELVKNLLK